jgi:hypothetical protein
LKSVVCFVKTLKQTSEIKNMLAYPERSVAESGPGPFISIKKLILCWF